MTLVHRAQFLPAKYTLGCISSLTSCCQCIQGTRVKTGQYQSSVKTFSFFIHFQQGGWLLSIRL